jgi:membrane-bound serine protease (ClpP class)
LQPTWVDGLLASLTTPGATVFLLVVGLTCLYIEFQMPGFGVAGLLAAVCFVLFFWARFLSETANSLELVMFLLGVIFLAIELFVLPGFGVTGVAGICLMLASLVLASQTFVIPSTETETLELAGNLAQIFGSMIAFFALAVVLAKFFPHIPVFGRMMLPPPGEADDGVDRPLFEEEAEFAESALVGAVGIAASPLRPAGRMKLDDRYYDVLTLGEFIESGSAIEVIEALPSRIVVRASRRA